MRDWMNKTSQSMKRFLFAVKGIVSVNHPDKNSVSVETSNEIRQIPLVTPWGFKSHPPSNSKVQVILNWAQGREATAVGVITNDGPKVEPGEAALWHRDGMTILLKNDGTIRFNSKGGHEVIKVDSDGEIYLHGRRVRKSEEVGGAEI